MRISLEQWPCSRGWVRCDLPLGLLPTAPGCCWRWWRTLTRWWDHWKALQEGINTFCTNFRNTFRIWKHVFFLTRLPSPAMDRLAPRPRTNAVDGLNSDLVLCPLLQVFYSELSLQPVHDGMGKDPAFWSGFWVLDAVANEIWVAVVLPLWKRLRGVCFVSFHTFKQNEDKL